MEDGLIRHRSLVLLGEDDDDFLMIARLALENAKFSGILRVERSAGDLMGFLQEGAIPDLIILDFHLPQNDWRATLRDIKGQKLYEPTAIVVLTSSRDQEARPFGVFPRCSYMPKPMSFRGWKSSMVHILRRYLPVDPLMAPTPVRNQKSEIHRLE